jgi:toxin CptA
MKAMHRIPPLMVILRPSRMLLVLLGSVALGAVVLSLTLPLPWSIRIGMSLLVTLAAVHAIRLYALQRAPRSILGLEVNAQGQLYYADALGVAPAELLGSSTATPWLTVLNLRVAETYFPRHVILLPDTADTDALRRLRVWLRWGQGDA